MPNVGLTATHHGDCTRSSSQQPTSFGATNMGNIASKVGFGPNPLAIFWVVC